MKHKSGPWRLDPDNLNVYSDGLIAQVYGHLHNLERQSNARLIASAPELLDELKIAINTIETLTENQPNDAILALLGSMKAVVTKAGGDNEG